MQLVQHADVAMPALGFGTFRLTPEVAYRSVRDALEVGYRHVDTARAYQNEEAVGRALADSGVDRDDVFLTTKFAAAEARPADVHRAARNSLDRLGVDRLDLLLYHWPALDVSPIEATLEAMTEVRDASVTRHIGVSNFPARLLQRAFEVAPIVTDQVEHHPYLAVPAIDAVLDRHGGILTAYCPIARGEVVDDPVLQAIATDHGATPAQVSLRWLLQRGRAAIPRSSRPERIAANFDVFGFSLSDDDLVRIDGLASGRRLVDPAWAPEWDPDPAPGQPTD